MIIQITDTDEPGLLISVRSMQFKTYIAVGIIFVFVFRTHAAYAQESAFAIEQGFGQSATGYAGGIFVLPVDDTKPDVSSIGLSYYSRPVQALFRLNAGLAFYSIDDDEASFKYLRLPAGLEICLGRKLQILPAAGLSGSYLLEYNPDAVTEDYLNSRSLFQLGWYGRLGIGFLMMDQYMINLAWQQNSDLSFKYKVNRFSPGGAPYSLDVKGYEGMLFLGIRYNIISSSNKPHRQPE